MKVLNSSISMKAEHTFLQKAQTSFATHLEAGAVQTVEKKNAAVQEQFLLDRLRLMLLWQLLGMFQSNRCNRDEFYQWQESSELTLKTSKAEARYTFKEEEKLNVEMKGLIQTDSQSIELNLNLSLSRSFVSTQSVSADDFIDPLVITLKGGLPKLSDTNFWFDIDSDGKTDQISELQKDSGYLAYDRNDNGTIDDGSELFGTKSGNGFADLALYDEDNNCWIDENDPIFNKLRIWSREDGESRLITLGEAGVGALYLGQTHSPFLMKNSENETLGRLRSSGLFLSEEGNVGTLAQMDLCRHDTTVIRQPLKDALAAV